MGNKKQRLIARARQTLRTPNPSRLLEAEVKKKSYKIVAVSLYTPEAEWVDEATNTLRKAGNPKANRSLVVREAILRLQEALKDKKPEDVLKDFTIHESRRSPHK